MLRVLMVAGALVVGVVNASAQTPAPRPKTTEPKMSVAAEADILAYGLPGYSGILSVTTPQKLQVAFGVGRYAVPSFLLKGDDNYDAVKWKATATSLQALRVTYRFKGAMKSGPALGVIALNQHWRLRAEKLDGETRFWLLNVGVTSGYYIHAGRHFYLYPTFAFTRNAVHSGDAMLKGTRYAVEKFGPNGSLHAGWEWGSRR